MSYYFLRLSSDPEVIGVRNGIQQVEICKECFRDKRMYDEILDYFCNRDAEKSIAFGALEHFELQCVKPLVGAVLTEFLSYGPCLPDCPFMIGAGAYNCFLEAGVKNCSYINARVVSEGRGLDYKLFYFPPFDYSVIDFQSSVFFTGNRLSGKTYHKFDSFQHFDDARAKSSLIYRSESVVLNSNFDLDLKLFELKFGTMIASRQLVDELRGRNCSGIDFIPLQVEVVAGNRLKIVFE